MFFKIVIKNMKYNIKNYILFFIGNMIGVTTFFVFWGIYSVVKSSASNSINLEYIGRNYYFSFSNNNFCNGFNDIFIDELY